MWRWLLVCAVALQGCDLTESCDPQTDPDCINLPPDTDVPDTDTAHVLTYSHLLVLDLSDPTFGTDGTELDGVELMHSGDSTTPDWAACSFGADTEVQTTEECNQALGPPEDPQGTCTDLDNAYTVLGVGGSIVLSFSDNTKIQPGDTIHAYACTAVTDVYSVFVGNEPSPTSPDWVACAENVSGSSTCTVKESTQ